MCMAHFNKQSIDEVNEMTLTEYYCLSYARNERNLYKEYLIHKQAFLGREIEAQKKKKGGKKGDTEYVYKSFDDFFDYEKAERDLLNLEESEKEKKERDEMLDILNMVKKANKN